jgi:uncharacterized protein (TIGR02996 family)
MDERAAFEKGIDDNPLESTNHLVYADWLDENGDEREAAFRRSIGKWIAERGGRIQSSGKSGFSLGRTHPWQAYKESLPDGVLDKYITRDGRADPLDPVGQDSTDAREYGRGLHWPTYRDMEMGLRRAFYANYDRPEQRYSRAARAVRRLRRK